MNPTEKLKARLWRCYGHPNFPAEWDGKTYGGGKISQRFWEYHQTIELLELTPDSVVLDIGGGSPVTGAGFFTRVIAPHVKEVHVMDVNIGESQTASANVVFHRRLAGYETLSTLLQANPQITHIACISVFEHIPHDVRCGMVKAVNEFFSGNTFVATLEYHTQESFFEHQLTVRTMSELFEFFTNLYPDQIHKSPVLAENSYQNVSVGRKLMRRLGVSLNRWGTEPGVPRWYPLALRFRRVAE
jgi:cyclopropane fatty-acyl-phospholipid synthase-like methyltransferase